MKPTDVIKYLHHYIGCPFRYEYSYIHEGVEYKDVVFSKVDTLITDEYMAVFDGTCDGEPLEEYYIFFDRFDNFRLILTHPAKLKKHQKSILNELKGDYVGQVMYCFENYIDIFGLINAGLAIDADPSRRKNHTIPNILISSTERKIRSEHQQQSRKNKSK